jgi:transposase InsO family protein
MKMPWKEVTTMSLRLEFVRLALHEGANMSELCRRFGISRKTGYKWLDRRQQKGVEALIDQSRRPHTSPNRTPAEIEELVLQVRDRHPVWGGRKINSLLLRSGHTDIPHPSTITGILHRNGRIDAAESVKHKAYQRFEKEHPNELWQMDFKGHFAMTDGGRCHPLTVLDDCSRFLLGLRACANETHETVVQQLTSIFRLYGMPDRMLMDNGSPWGSDGNNPYTRLTVWLIRLGINISHGRPYHPQTQGKDERLHRTLNAELISRRHFSDLRHCQPEFDDWRDTYNQVRPHQALDMCVPGERYQPSSRSFPETLPTVLYDTGDIVRKVDVCGRISFRSQKFRVGKAFHQQSVAIRPTDTDGVFQVFFSHKPVAQISFHDSDI